MIITPAQKGVFLSLCTSSLLSSSWMASTLTWCRSLSSCFLANFPIPFVTICTWRSIWRSAFLIFRGASAMFLIRLQLKCVATRWRTGGDVKGKLANAVGSQYPSHYLGTWCIQHYYRWCPHLAADLNGLVRFAERRNLVSTRVPSHFSWPLSRHGSFCLGRIRRTRLERDM